MEASPPRRKQRLSSPDPAAEAAAPSLDSLPPEILEKIISCLHVRDAVRTCSLSRAWRRRWESTPGIRFFWDSSAAAAPPAAIDAVLARYACPVRDFCYWEIPEEAFARTDEWIPALAGKGVQSLTLRFREYLRVDIHTLHLAVFSCRELTHLTLHGCFVPTAPPSFAGFPKLTWLSLTMVGFHEHGERDLEAMIHMSPLLETLELKDIQILGDEFDEWVIQAPNLRHLSFEADEDYGLQIGELPSLDKAYVTIQEYSSVDRDFVKFLTRLAQVRVLEFRIPIVDSQLNDEVDLEFFSAQCTNSLFPKLKTVTVTDTPLWSNEMYFIEFILSKARLLCALFVYKDDDSDYSNPSEEAVIQLAKFRRASPKARVFFRTMDEYWRHEIVLSKMVDLL
ncbi:F-box/FBD/LRR-repeat protein At1g13570-like [Panicum virgatum]|uniref:F-box domain-containing protein n=1 Tax=Panicum virgatum TaxID=38727 RepID=A0A8T0RHW0_PANVG|nr:F-box/FBD/LRR-repeat protein At1g13570-like [Panicum virgatum]KAG2584373.1 hypothetical protein PVAP13_6KG292600 [Panicum virgatum]